MVSDEEGNAKHMVHKKCPYGTKFGVQCWKRAGIMQRMTVGVCVEYKVQIGTKFVLLGDCQSRNLDSSLFVLQQTCIGEYELEKKRQVRPGRTFIAFYNKKYGIRKT